MLRRAGLPAAFLLALAGSAHAQAPAWAGATNGSAAQVAGSSRTRSVATDASGNVFVTGSFFGQVVFGSTTLTSLGSNDLFVAKYVPATNTWAWAQSGGGTGLDEGYSVAVSGTSVYVTGSITNSSTNASGVLFGGTGTAPGTVPQYGTNASGSYDLVLAKYTDNGSSATLRWTQVGGGGGNDQGQGIAVSGTSVYVTGQFVNTRANAQNVVFGGSGTTPGTVQVNGANTSSSSTSDLVLAKYQDNGATATLAWTQVGGGTQTDVGYSVAVSGTSVYVTGVVFNSSNNTYGVVFGGSGTTPGTVPVNGASSSGTGDLLLAKYQDNGASASLAWTQVGGGGGNDIGSGVAVRGTSVYVAGFLTNNTANANAVLFGGTGTTPGTVPQYGASATTSADLMLAKYTDNGATASYVWSQVGGGTGQDFGYELAVSGTSLFVTGSLNNSSTNGNGVVFGGAGATAGTAPVAGVAATTSVDLVLAKYTDNGPTATFNWAQTGGGPNSDLGDDVAVSGQNVLVTGYVVPPASFGAFTIASPAGTGTNVLARLVDATLLPTRPAAVGSAGLLLHPNPTTGRATLSGATPGTAAQVLDALGRVVATATTDATGTAALPETLPAGVYVVRAGAGAARLVVE